MRAGWTYGAAFLLAAVALAGQVACQAQPEGTVVARVGRERLTLQDIESRIPAHIAGRITTQEKQRLVEGWVEEELLYQEALNRKLDRDPVVAVRISNAARDLLIAELLEREFKRDSEVLDDEVQAYYEAHREDFVRDQPEIRARHVLVQSRSDLDRVRKRLREGDPFDQVAREESIDVSAETGGDLGYFTEDMVDSSFWAACEKAKTGRRTPAATRLGQHVIEVLDRREAGSAKDLLEVRGEIRQHILAGRRQARRLALLDQLRSQVSWTVALDALEGGKQE